MRPARGRIAAAVATANLSRNRSCVVRLEKCDESEDERKKMTGPLKKRPVVMKKQLPAMAQPKTRRRAAGEDLSEYMLVTARARRTPKPNPKYNNEDLVTPRNKSKDNVEQSDEEEPDVYQSSEAEVGEEELENESSEEEFQPHRPMTRGGLVRAANGELVRRGKGRPPKSKEPSPENKPMPRGGGPTPTLKRRIEFDNSDNKVFDAILAQNKRLNIELYDASDSDASVISPARRMVRGAALRQAQQQQKPISRLTMKPEPRKFPENSRGRPAPAPKVPTSEEDEDDPDEFEAATTGAASTIDDFETMPTFTIVNINDIINKKGDVLIQKTNQQQRLSGGQVSSDSSRNTTVDRSVDDDSHVSPNQASRNRRKSMHTTILSDKIDPEKLKNPPPRTPFPLRKPPVSISQHSFINNNNNLASKSLLNNNQIFKSAPRILNSVLARKNRAAQEQQEQAQLKHQQQQQQQQQKQQAQHQKAEQKQLQKLPQSNHNHQSKENHHFNNFRSALAASAAAQKSAAAAVAAGAAAASTSKAPFAARKLPAEKIMIQRQGNKIIKKITCFETWHVINIPPVEAVVPKLQFDMSLMQLGNAIKEVQLPSADWTYKVTLQKLANTQLIKFGEHFTGDVQDANIDPDEKHKYQPINVMFRRTSRNQKLRMPYDRAVIFKNKTYFTNIDGKNVRLLGAPHIIGSLSELEVLLEIVDEMSLGSPFVEQTTFVM